MQNDFSWAYGKVNVEGSINYYFQNNIAASGSLPGFLPTGNKTTSASIYFDFPDGGLNIYPSYSLIHGGGHDSTIAQGHVLSDATISGYEPVIVSGATTATAVPVVDVNGVTAFVEVIVSAEWNTAQRFVGRRFMGELDISCWSCTRLFASKELTIGIHPHAIEGGPVVIDSTGVGRNPEYAYELRTLRDMAKHLFIGAQRKGIPLLNFDTGTGLSLDEQFSAWNNKSAYSGYLTTPIGMETAVPTSLSGRDGEYITLLGRSNEYMRDAFSSYIIETVSGIAPHTALVPTAIMLSGGSGAYTNSLFSSTNKDF